MFADRYQDALSAGPFDSDGDATTVIARAEGACVVKSVDVFNTASVATHATNYITMKLINIGTDATGTTVIATASTSQTGGSAVAANVAFPLTVTAANASVADGETIAFVRDEATTDAANMAACRIVVRVQQTGAV